MNETSNFKTCEITGFLEPLDGKGILPRHKTAFLKNYKKTGNQTKSIEALGFRYNELEWHLQNDAVFKEEFRLTQLSMKHELEGYMFERGLSDNGSKDRQMWLQKHFPDEYATKAASTNKKPVKADPLAGLLDKI